MSGLRVERLTLIRGERPILRGLDARFDAGAVTVVVGPTGAGKSTLLHLLGGLLRPTSGVVYADAQPISRFVAAHRDRYRARVGLCLQAPHLLAGLTVAENVALPLVPRRETALAARVAEALAWLDLTPLAGAMATRLSGGEQQRVALARALVHRPDFVLADEPTAHQDEAHAEQVRALLSREALRGAVVVVATHQPEPFSGPRVSLTT